MTKAQREIKLKLGVLSHATNTSNISKTCRHFCISRQSYYHWKDRYERFGEEGLINKEPKPKSCPWKVAADIEKKVIHLRERYHLGSERIHIFLMRYHPEMKVSASSIYRLLKRHGIYRLPRNTKRRTITLHRYEKQMPGHHIQVDGKFVSLLNHRGKKVRRFQYTAIDDATRIRALRIYPKHNQTTAIRFIDEVIRKFPFRIHTIRSDNGHEFQARFHFHVEDQGIMHVYIKPSTPRLNGQVERSHLTYNLEFYQLLNDTDDVDLNKKLKEWEKYYNFDRSHKSLRCKTPYEILWEKITNGSFLKYNFRNTTLINIQNFFHSHKSN